MRRWVPAGWHSVTPRIIVQEPAPLVAFLKTVFGATGDFEGERPALLTIGDSHIMVGGAGIRDVFPAFLYVYVEDVDGDYRRALEAGAESQETPFDTPYGDRRGMVRDPWGNVWQIATHLRSPPGGRKSPAGDGASTASRSRGGRTTKRGRHPASRSRTPRAKARTR
jgi:uncharacterized glyoxalase superfamily protein PhnB